MGPRRASIAGPRGRRQAADRGSWPHTHVVWAQAHLILGCLASKFVRADSVLTRVPHDGLALVEIGVGISEQLDIVPAADPRAANQRVKYA